MKNYIVKVRIKSNDCEVGVAKVFVRDGNAKFASKVALDFFSDKYEYEVVGVPKIKAIDKQNNLCYNVRVEL